MISRRLFNMRNLQIKTKKTKTIEIYIYILLQWALSIIPLSIIPALYYSFWWDQLAVAE